MLSKFIDIVQFLFYYSIHVEDYCCTWSHPVTLKHTLTQNQTHTYTHKHTRSR